MGPALAADGEARGFHSGWKCFRCRRKVNRAVLASHWPLDVVVPAPIERIPVWVRAGSIVVTYPAEHVAVGQKRLFERNIVEKNQERISALVLDMLTFSKEREPVPEPANT